MLDACFTLIVFTPILIKLSADIAPPLHLGALEGSWLLTMAFLSSLLGLAGAALFGQKLVGLEVANQRVEALLRKDLVLLETTPAVIVGTSERSSEFLPQTYFSETLHSLKTNYFSLFKHFGLLNFWLSLFDQVRCLRNPLHNTRHMHAHVAGDGHLAVRAGRASNIRSGPRAAHHAWRAGQDEQQLRPRLRQPQCRLRKLGRDQRLSKRAPPPARI